MGYYLLDYNPGTQQWGYPRRGATLSGTCIIHTAECAMDLDGADDSAENCAHFIAGRADYGSYHRLSDSDSTIRMVPWEYEAWQDSETNPWAVGISAAVAAARWLEIPAERRDRIYRNMASAAADFVVYMRDTHGITVPVRRITGAEARARVPGFCAHGDSGLYRSDPGADFDWDLFFHYTNEALGGTLAPAGTITPQEEFMAVATEDQLNFIIKALGSLVDNAATKTDLKDQAAKTPSDVWSYKNPGIGDDDAFQILRDALAATDRLADVVATAAANAAVGGASIDQIKEAIKQALREGTN